MMAWPFSPLTTYVANSVPAIKASDLNDFQSAINETYGPPGVFGMGIDGSAALDGTNTFSWASKSGANYTLTRDIQVDDLTFSGTATLYTASFRVFVRGVLTLGASNVLHCDGFAGSGATGGNGTSTVGTLAGSGSAGAGTSSNANGTAGAAVSNALGGGGGKGGDYLIAGKTGGAGGTATVPVAALGSYYHPFALLTGYSFGLVGGAATLTVLAGGGGGGGGASGGGPVGASGGGGAGGGVLLVAARKIVNAGAIRANGGAGAAEGGGAAGSGGGGGGGLVLLTYAEYSGAGTVTATGGAAGAIPGGGDPGVAGTDGRVFILPITDV